VIYKASTDSHLHAACEFTSAMNAVKNAENGREGRRRACQETERNGGVNCSSSSSSSVQQAPVPLAAAAAATADLMLLMLSLSVTSQQEYQQTPAGRTQRASALASICRQVSVTYVGTNCR